MMVSYSINLELLGDESAVHSLSGQSIINDLECHPVVTAGCHTSIPYKSPIQTFVFVDLETTGLDKDARLIEVSMMAVSRYDLERMETRSEHKKSAIVGPDKILRFHPAHLNHMDVVSTKGKGVRRQLFSDHGNDDSSTDRNDAVKRKQNEAEDISVFRNVPAQRPMTADASTDTCHLFSKQFYSHLYREPQMPRIVQKMTRVFNPKTLIYPDNEEFTGLNNIMVELMPVFSAEFCNSFKEFLNLPKPLCILGHNAYKYDLPIILAEIIKASGSDLHKDILCSDTLIAFKLLDELEAQEEIQEICSMVDANLNWFLDDSQILPSFPNKRKKLEENAYVSVNVPSFPPCTPEKNGTHHVSHNTPVLLSSASTSAATAPDTPITPSTHSQYSLLATPVHQSLEDSIMSPPRTPALVRRLGLHSYTTPISKPKLLKFPPNCSFKSKIQITRKCTNYNIGMNPKKQPFSQGVLYHRLFGRHYNAHRAEDDCEAMLKIAGHYGPKFTQTIDAIKKPFSEVKPLWLNTASLWSNNFKESWR